MLVQYVLASCQKIMKTVLSLLLKALNFNGQIKQNRAAGQVLTISPPYLLSFHILRLAGVLFLPQDTVNILSDFLGFFHFFGFGLCHGSIAPFMFGMD